MGAKFVYPWLLLHPNIPNALHGLNPRSLMGSAWWDAKRQSAYSRNDFHCWACGVYKFYARYHQWLEAHEVYSYDYKNARLKFEEIVALCHLCHNSIHTGRLEMLLLEKKIDSGFYHEVFTHKAEVLSRASQLTEKEEQRLIQWQWIAPGGQFDEPAWTDWKLVFDGKEFSGNFDDIEEWADYYRRLNNE